MFRGRAKLMNPDTNDTVGHLTETCEDNGSCHVRVVLEPPMTLTGTAFLAIFSNTGGVIEVTAKNSEPTEIREFHGKSASGCLLDKSEVSLVRSPGGELSTLLEVLARGHIRQE
jgi:hypothetical protein